MLWSRRLLREIPHADLHDHGPYLAAPGQELAPNVGLTFVGHSVVEKPTLFRSHLFIDTGMGTIPDGRLYFAGASAMSSPKMGWKARRGS